MSGTGGIDCSSVGCAPPPLCSIGCEDPCGCCPCLEGERQVFEGTTLVCAGGCFTSFCGDGVVGAGEECDDGNFSAGDGCSVQCRFEVIQVVGSTCALSSGGTVKCWGSNLQGESGLGDTQTRGDEPGEMGENLPTLDLGSGRRALAIAAGGSQGAISGHVCAVLDDGSLRCWGANTFGELGLGDTEPRGDEPGETGDALPVVDLGSGRHVTSIALGWYHSCAILDDGSLKCWGNNAAFQLGNDNPANLGDEHGEMGDALPIVDLGPGRTAKQVAAGKDHTCALLDDDSLKCWGSNDYQALGLEVFQPPPVVPAQMPSVNLGTSRHALRLGAANAYGCAVLDNGLLKCWGKDVFGELGTAPLYNGNRQLMGDLLPAVDLGPGRHAIDVALGGIHTCALLDDGSVKCWGYGVDGEIGIGVQGTDVPTDAVMLGAGRRATSLSASYVHTCAILDDGTLKCWGYNGYGTLGLGDTVNRGTSLDQMGDNLPIVDLAF